MWEAGPEDHVDLMSDSLPRRQGDRAQAFLRQRRKVTAVFGEAYKVLPAPADCGIRKKHQVKHPHTRVSALSNSRPETTCLCPVPSGGLTGTSDAEFADCARPKSATEKTAFP